MGSVNNTNYGLDTTVRVFDSFYGFELIIQSEEYDAVLSYFKSIYTSPEAAGNFTVTLFRIANEQGIPVLSLLDQIKASSTSAELNITIAYYLNNMRSSSTLLGLASPTQPNYYAARNVRS
jgi:pyruvate/2-oxoacid:ferredoxin oxidoreductase alpha subunit